MLIISEYEERIPRTIKCASLDCNLNQKICTFRILQSLQKAAKTLKICENFKVGKNKMAEVVTSELYLHTMFEVELISHNLADFV